MTLEQRVEKSIKLMEERLPRTLQKPGTMLAVYLLLTNGRPFPKKPLPRKGRNSERVIVTSAMILRRFGLKV